MRSVQRLIGLIKCFGFCSLFSEWIQTILSSTFLSINFNGKSYDYFNCNRRVRQEDPLSPFIYCLVEDVFNRLISKAVDAGSLHLIKAAKNNYMPSHIMYADDILLFCNAKISNVKILCSIFKIYSVASVK